MTHHCATCDCWLPPGERQKYGTCHRLAPTPSAYAFSDDGKRTVWPLTLATEGCGQWMPVEADSTEENQVLIATALGLEQEASVEVILDAIAALKETRHVPNTGLLLPNCGLDELYHRVIAPGSLDPVEIGENGAG